MSNGPTKITTKITKDDLKKPDAFLHTMETSVSFLEKYKILLGVTLGLLIVGTVVRLTFDHFQERTELKGADALYSVEAGFLKAREGFERAKMEAMAPTPPKSDEKPEDKKEPNVPATGDLEKDYGASVAGLEQVVKDHPNTGGGAQAALLLAEVYLEYKQPEKALPPLEKVESHLNKSGMLYGLVHMMHGTILATVNNCASAVQKWEAVVGNEASKHLHPDALLKSGICYESMKQNDKAMAAYQRLMSEYVDSTAAQTAKTLLRVLNLQQNTSAAPTAG